MVKRITVTVSDEMHYKIKLQAAKEGTSISDKLREMIEKWIDDDSPRGSEDVSKVGHGLG
jgi:predicted CopG family antitoxin